MSELERRKREVPTNQCIAPMNELPPRKRGRPLLLGEYYELVQEYIKGLRKAGSVVNTSLVVAAAEGLLLCRNRSLLVQFGGSIKLNKPWAKSLLIKMGFVKRKATMLERCCLLN